MPGFIKFAVVGAILAACCASPADRALAQAVTADGTSLALIRKISLLGAGNNVEVEILASQPISPQIKLVTGPDRLVIDLPNSQPSEDLHRLKINRGEVTGVRVGVFSVTPPVTRVVLDLTTAETYQAFPSGRTLIVKLGGSGTGEPKAPQAPQVKPAAAAPVVVSEADMPATLPIPKARVEVRFSRGMLSIHADKATLSDVLLEVHRFTGAEIQIPPEAQQEQMVADIGPSPAREAMAALLNGSHFNFIMVGSDRDPNALHSVILTAKEGGSQMPSGSPPAQEYSSENQPPPEPVQGGQGMPHTEDAPDETPPPPAPQVEEGPAPPPG
jgi:AMIN domain